MGGRCLDGTRQMRKHKCGIGPNILVAVFKIALFQAGEDHTPNPEDLIYDVHANDDRGEYTRRDVVRIVPETGQLGDM